MTMLCFWLGSCFLFSFLQLTPLSSNDTNDPELQLRLSFVSFHVSTCLFICFIGYRI